MNLRYGGVVLCGGKSRRMGLPKATLPFGGELMVQRVVRKLSQVVRPIAVVVAGDQQLPALPNDVIVTRDRREGRGPLEGLYAGMLAVRDRAEAVYATSCDVPLLATEFVRRMIAELGDHDVAVPVEDKFHHPLAGVYRTSLVPSIEKLLENDRLRPVFLFEAADTHRVPVERLTDVDPELHTLLNLNEPSDYQRALDLAGFGIDDEVRQRLQL